MTVPSMSISEVVVPTYILGLDVAPAHIHLARAAEQVYTRVFREAILAQSLKDADYDFVLIDCPPSLGVLTTNSLYACDFIVIPCQISRYSLDGLADLLTTIEDGQEPVPWKTSIRETCSAILLTMFDKRNRVTNEYILEQLAALPGEDLRHHDHEERGPEPGPDSPEGHLRFRAQVFRVPGLFSTHP